MIASYGGLEIDDAGNRTFRGSGGMVGSLSLPGLGLSYTMGAGPEYQAFTPGTEQGLICLDCSPGGERDPPPDPRIETVPEPTPTPTDPYPTQTGGTINRGPINRLPGGYDPTDTTTGGGTIQTTINTMLSRLMNGLGQATGQGPLYLFTPNQPVAVNGGGVTMKQLLILGALGFGLWFAYKRFAK